MSGRLSGLIRFKHGLDSVQAVTQATGNPQAWMPDHGGLTHGKIAQRPVQDVRARRSADHAAHKRFSQEVKTPVSFSQHWANSSVRHVFDTSRIKLALRQTPLGVGALLSG